MSEDKLSEREQQLFDSLDNVMAPTTGLGTQIITRLRKEGLLKKTNPVRAYIKAVAAVAAAILIFFSGIYFEKIRYEPPIAINPNQGYMLLLYEGQNFREGNPEQMAIEYGQWMQNIFDKGVKITGQELKKEKTVVTAPDQIETPPQDEGEKITGYFIIQAPSLEEALEIAQDNPHTRYGGTIAVKSFLIR